jgi:Spy/CpxP family protein refolding chaperone
MCRSHFLARARRRGFVPGHHQAEHIEDAGPGEFAGPWEGPFMRHGHRFGDDSFGVRRPLRFLAHKLELSDEQVGQLARILDDLKTERAQASVDDRRTLADFADAISGETFDTQRAAAAGQRRSDSAQRLREAVNKALEQLHALLNPQQRSRLSYLIRAGVLSL